jgi:hypothetical protein
MSEILSGQEDPRAIVGLEFKALIERVVGPIPEKRIEHLGDMEIQTQDPDARVKTQAKDLDITYIHSEDYYQLGFQGRQSCEIKQGNLTGEFSLRDDGVIVRRRHVSGPWLFPAHTTRELGLEESTALVDLLESPILELAKLDVVFGLTENEEAELTDDIERLTTMTNEYRAEIEDINRAMQMPFFQNPA